MTNQSLMSLVGRTLTARQIKIIGPPWMAAVRFDVSAKYPPNTKPEDQSRMMKTLLEDRFGLASHEEIRDLPGYLLVVAKGGFKLKPVDPGDGPSNNSQGNPREVELKAERTPLSNLADSLGFHLGAVVVDKTGIAGCYTFQMKWSREQIGAPPPNFDDPSPGPSLYNQLQEVLGLKLQPAKVPSRVLVVDKLERVPTEN